MFGYLVGECRECPAWLEKWQDHDHPHAHTLTSEGNCENCENCKFGQAWAAKHPQAMIIADLAKFNAGCHTMSLAMSDPEVIDQVAEAVSRKLAEALRVLGPA